MRKDVALLQRNTSEAEPLLGSVCAPVRVVWGEEDGWLDPSRAGVLAGKIPDAEIPFVHGAGRLVMEGVSEWVAETLAGLFGPRGAA